MRWEAVQTASFIASTRACWPTADEHPSVGMYINCTSASPAEAALLHGRLPANAFVAAFPLFLLRM